MNLKNLNISEKYDFNFIMNDSIVQASFEDD